jgi:hypothetical protein
MTTPNDEKLKRTRRFRRLRYEFKAGLPGGHADRRRGNRENQAGIGGGSRLVPKLSG